MVKNAANKATCLIKSCTLKLLFQFLNQAHVGLHLACTWFLRIVSVQTSVCVYVCVCVSTPEAINN